MKSTKSIVLDTSYILPFFKIEVDVVKGYESKLDLILT